MELRQTCQATIPRVWSHRREAIAEELPKLERPEEKFQASLPDSVQSSAVSFLFFFFGQNSAR